MGAIAISLVLFVFIARLRSGYCTTGAQDAAALLALMDTWQNTPPTWRQSSDACGTPWEGVACSNSRVTSLSLSSMKLKGTLSSDISQLSELTLLDLSFNKDLGGTLPASIGNLKKLTTLILAGCSFSGSIPNELSNLSQLSFMALNTNQFSGKVPASLGNLSNLYWFDVSENQLTGSLPISTSSSPGLDLLLNAKHFHFNKNQLSGSIPEKLFSSGMKLIHVLFDANMFTGDIPASVGLLQNLEVLRLDKNRFGGSVPSSISNLTSIRELNLANNTLTGPIPDLTGMNNLNYLDLSNNTFDTSEVPSWVSTLTSLNSLALQSTNLSGQVPEKFFSSPLLEQVLLDNNAINGTLDIGSNFSPQLQVVSFQDNDISTVTVRPNYTGSLILIGNPVCSQQLASTPYCRPQNQIKSYSTFLANCAANSCPSDQSINPRSCQCEYPYEGTMIFRAPFFRDLTNVTLFQALEKNLWTELALVQGSVSLTDVHFNDDNYIQLHLKLFPSSGLYFNRSEIIRLGFGLSFQSFKPPTMFGPFMFIASSYPFPVSGGGKSSLSTGVVAGIAVGCVLLIIGVVVLGIYAFKQKKRAERARQQNMPFATWGSNVRDTGEAPKLKGVRCFAFEELKKCTNNFSQSNELGAGGYGKVYKGTLQSGEIVAIKRAEKGSMQGGMEFKTEIELLSRVHHKNLVTLVGFCFDQGEQMLVYEFIPNGTLRDGLLEKHRYQLDWNWRLKIALGSAKGLAYLHELADPPIIHRDVKSVNILLDENLNAKVADFGLSKLVSDSEKGHVSTQVKGTLGYLDPEYYMTQQLSEKSDVYSFGVVMLELITARQPIEKGKYVVREVRLAMDRNDVLYGLDQMMDPVIREETHLTGFTRFVDLAMSCVEESAAARPTMNELVKEIEMIIQSDISSGNLNSATSSVNYLNIKGAATDHPYDQPLPSRDASENAFAYSGGYSFVPKPEPK